MQRDRLSVARTWVRTEERDLRPARELRAADSTIDETIERDASALDLFYLTSRYPDTIGDEDPGDVISRIDALAAFERGKRIVTFVRERLATIVCGAQSARALGTV